MLDWTAKKCSGRVATCAYRGERGRLDRRAVAIRGNLHWQYSPDSWSRLRGCGEKFRRRETGWGCELRGVYRENRLVRPRGCCVIWTSAAQTPATVTDLGYKWKSLSALARGLWLLDP